MLKNGVSILVVGLFAYLISCGGGGGSGSPNPPPVPPNQGGDGGGAAFVNSVSATATEVAPGEIVIIKAVTTAPGPTFTWSTSAGSLLSQLDGSATAGPFSMLWWRAPTTAGTISLVTVTVNSSAGSLATSLAVSVNSAGAVTGNWRSYNGDAENTGRTSPGAIAPSTLDLIWKIGLSAPSRAPVAAVSDGVVFAGDAAGSLLAANATSGAMLWTSSLTGEVAASPVVGGGKAYFVTTAGEVAAYDAASGQPLWSFSTGSPIFSAPTYIDGLLLVGTQDGVLYALRTQKAIANRSDRIWWQMAFAGEHLVAPLAQSQPNILFEDARNSTVFVGTREGNVYAIRSADGTILWRRQVTGILLHSPAVFSLGASRWVAVASEEGNLYIWNAATGDSYAGRSPYLALSRAISAAPAFMDGLLFFSSRTGNLFAVDLATGNYAMSITLLPNVGCFATPVLVPQGAGRLPTAFYPCFEALNDSVPPPNEFTTLRGVIYRVSQFSVSQPPSVARDFATGWTNRPFYPTIAANQDALIGASAIHTVSVPQARGRLFFAGMDGALYSLGEPDIPPVTPPAWPMKRLNTLNNGYYADDSGAGGGPLRGALNLLWTQTMNSRVTGSPIVARNTLLIGNWDKRLEAYRASDGLKVWEYLADESIRSTPVVTGANDIAFYTFSSQLIVGQMDGNRFVHTLRDPSIISMFTGSSRTVVYTDPGDGTPPTPTGGYDSADVGRPRDAVWNAILASSPLSINDALYVYQLHPFFQEDVTMDSDGNVIGTERPTNEPNSSFLNLRTGVSMTLQDLIPTTAPVFDRTFGPNGSLYFVGFEGFNPESEQSALGNSPVVVRVEIGTGRLLRRSLAAVGDMIGGTPAFTDGVLFFASQNGRLFAMNPAYLPPPPQAQVERIEPMTGVPALPPGANVQGSVVIYRTGPGAGILLFGADDGRLYAYDYTIITSNSVTMSLRWSFISGASIWSSPAVDPTRFVVYFGSNDKNFYALDLFTGIELWRFTSGDRFISSPVITAGKVFSVDEGGRIYAFGR
jgi:outer membrane protein assembly factor BamB